MCIVFGTVRGSVSAYASCSGGASGMGVLGVISTLCSCAKSVTSDSDVGITTLCSGAGSG